MPRADASRSFPPPAELHQAPVWDAGDDEPDDSGDTNLIPNAFEVDPHDSPTRAAAMNEQGSFDDYDEEWDGDEPSSSELRAEDPASAPSDWEIPDSYEGAGPDEDDAEPTRVEPAPQGARAPIDDTELLELSATTVATDLDMDWDEDEAKTSLRDEAWGVVSPFGQTPPAPAGSAPPPPAPPSVLPSGRPSPFPASRAPMASQHPGMPSPFGGLAVPPSSASANYPPVDPGFGFEEEATRVMTSAPPPAIETSVGSQWPQPAPGKSRVGAALAVVATVLVAFGAYAWLQPGGSATVTLVTQPVDAEVSIDGRPLTGQTSPFTLQGLSTDVEHEIEIARAGYVTHTASFGVTEGEVKALPEVQLAPAHTDTGFALDSVPSGAKVFVDGEAVEGATPVRLDDLSAGLHRIRLESRGFEPWQTQIALVEGQMIELPAAALATVTAVPGGRPRAMAAARSARESSKSTASSSPRSQSRAKSRSSSSPRAKSRSTRTAPRAKSRTKSRFATTTAPRAAPARSSGGGAGQGTLRVNSRPWSQVFVDGRFVGNTPQMNIPLAAGRHKIKLVNSQMGMTKRMRVKVQAGKTTTKVVNLIE